MKKYLSHLSERHIMHGVRVLMVAIAAATSLQAMAATGPLVHVKSDKCISTVGAWLTTCEQGASYQQFEKVPISFGTHMYRTSQNTCLAVLAGDSVLVTNETCDWTKPSHQWTLVDGMIRNVGANACIASGGLKPALAPCNPQDANVLWADGSAGVGIFNPLASQCLAVNARGAMESGSCSHRSGALFDYRADRRIESMARPGQCIGATTQLGLVACSSAPTWTFSEERWQQDGTNNCVEIQDEHEPPIVSACGDWTNLRQGWSMGHVVKYLAAQPLDVWGVNSNADAFRSGLATETAPYAPPGAWQFMSLAGKVKKVSAGKKFVWSVDAVGRLKMCAQPCYATKAWVTSPQYISDVSHIDVEPSNGRIYVVRLGRVYWNSENGRMGIWNVLPTALVMKWVSASPSWIWAIQTNNAVWRCAVPCASPTSWQRVDGSLRNLDIRDGWVYGTSPIGTVLRRRADLTSDWESFPEAGPMDQVSIGRRDVWGLRAGKIYQCQRPCHTSSEWTQVPGQLSFIDAE